MKTVAIIAGTFTLSVADGLVKVSPLFQASVDVVFVGKNGTTDWDGFGQNRFDGLLLNVGEHMQNDFSVALNHAEHRWLCTG